MMFTCEHMALCMYSSSVFTECNSQASYSSRVVFRYSSWNQWGQYEMYLGKPLEYCPFVSPVHYYLCNFVEESYDLENLGGSSAPSPPNCPPLHVVCMSFAFFNVRVHSDFTKRHFSFCFVK